MPEEGILQENADNRRNKLLQIRSNALSADYIYSSELSRINWITNAITVLAIVVPIITTFSLVLAKDTSYAILLNTFSFIFSGFLLCLSVLALIFRLEHKKELYLISRRANIYISNEASGLLENPSVDPRWFYKYVSDQDARDKENISNIREKRRQEAYRYSMKLLHPSDSGVVCSVCGSSPYIFKKGACQLCGNTPSITGEKNVK